jgi:adenylate cyclase class IV
MPKEYEYSFQDFDKAKIISKLKDLKAVHKGIFLFRVQQFKLPNQPDIKQYRARVRDEGHRITMTIKTTTVDFDEEKEIIIDNFENGVALLLQLGCTKHVYFEKIREIWQLKNCEIVFDTPPGYPDVMEIESKTLAGLNKMVKLLGLLVVEKEEKNLFVELFGIDEKEFKKLNNITFTNVKKILTPLVTKNKKQFNALVDRQKTLFRKHSLENTF